MFGVQLSQSSVLALTILGSAFGLLWVVAIAWALLVARRGEREAERGSERERWPDL